MLPFMAKALLIWGETAPRREAPPHWLAAAERRSPLAAGWRLICIRSDRARVTPGLEHAGRLLKEQRGRPGERGARPGLRRGGDGTDRGLRASWDIPLSALPRAPSHRQLRARGSSQGTHHVAQRLRASPASGSSQERLRAAAPDRQRCHQLLLQATPHPGCCHSLQGKTCRPFVSGGCRGTERVWGTHGCPGACRGQD